MARTDPSPADSASELKKLRARVAQLEAAEAQRSRSEQQRVVFARLGQRLAGIASEKALMEVVCEETDALFGWEFSFMVHRPPGQDELRIISYVDTEDGEKKVFPGENQPLSGFSKPVHQVLKGKPVLINRPFAEAGPLLYPVATKRRSASMMYAPVRCDERVIGFFTIHSYTPDRYGEADLNILQQIADIVAPALERVYAEEALRLANDELELRVKQRTAELKAANQHLRRETKERKAALEAVQDSEARFRAVTENSLSGVYIYSGGRMLYVNSALAEIFGFSVEEILAMDPLLLVHPADQPIATEQIRRRLQREVDRSQYRFRGVRKDGTIIHCEALGRYNEHQGQPVIIGNILDITDRIRAEQALRKSERSLRKLTVGMDRRLESERAQIARELHDHLGQILTALNMNLAWVDKRVADGEGALKARMDESIGYVGQMTTIIRSLCKSLRPVVLDHDGLVEAIRSQVSEFEQYSRIRCDLSIRPAKLELDQALAITAFRIIQETLTNVARHAQATRCRVSVHVDDNTLVISVRDDGVGAPVGRLSGGHSLGILGMRERAAAMGGTFQIEGMAQGGILATARLPLNLHPAKANGKSRRRARAK